MLKALGFVMLLALVVMALSAPGALAGPVLFQAEEYPAALSGEQEGSEGHLLTAEGLSVKCNSATVAGELPEMAEEVLMALVHTECTAGGLAATVAAEGCQFRANANVEDIDVVCPTGKAIKVTAAAGQCELTVGSQEGLKNVDFVNKEGPPSMVSVEVALEGVKYTKTKDGVFCPFAGTGEKSDGTLTGKTLIEGSFGAEAIDVFLSDPCPEAPAWPEEDCAYWEGLEETEGELEEEWEPEEEQWPEEEGPAEEEEQAKRDPILFVHGFRGDEDTFKTFVGWFKADGWDAARLHNWKYKWWRSNEGIATEVEKKVNKLLAVTKAKQVDIVTHSMGALSSRFYIKEGGAANVDEWVSLGGPNHGTATANLCSGKYTACLEMKQGSKFLTELNAGDETPGAVRYKTWRTVLDVAIVPSKST